MLITKLSPSIGAIVDGVDLSVPLDDDTFTAVSDALTDHLVIFFRDRPLAGCGKAGPVAWGESRRV
ncbi:MAG: hypothetical protein O3C27_11935 [Actinomycetota bacterium]|nr:hypothetical protein [Actinomycetota bacterium]